MCVQKNDLLPNAKVSGDEDCLYLNVYQPMVRCIKDFFRIKRQAKTKTFLSIRRQAKTKADRERDVVCLTDTRLQ